MVANARATTKKTIAAKNTAAKRKSRPAVKKKRPIAKKLAETGKAMGSGSGARAKPANGYVDRPIAARTPPGVPGKRVVEIPLMKTLRAEHRHMASVMRLFSEQLNAIEGGELVDTHVVYEIMDYMLTWPDRFHHPREDLIYARVAEVDASTADDVDTLQRDHDNTAKQGRQLLRQIERWRLGKMSGTALIQNSRAYIDHIYEHMNLEEKQIFPRIEASLTLQDWRELDASDELRAVGTSVFGPRVQREFRNMSRKLRRNLRRSVERETLVQWIGLEALMESLDAVSIAYESVRDTTAEHTRNALQDSLKLFSEAPLSAPLRVAANNARAALRLLGDVAAISRETLQDLSRVNQERMDRVRLMDRGSPRR